MLVSVLCAVIAMLVIGSHEAFSKAKQVGQLREETKEYFVSKFCDLLKYYEDNCVHSDGALTDYEVAMLQEDLDSRASRVAAYYPGFTAPRLV